MNSTKEYSQLLISLGNRLREIRHKKNLTLEQVEELGFITWRHLQRIETGKNVNLITIAKICDMYEISLSDLFKELHY